MGIFEKGFEVRLASCSLHGCHRCLHAVRAEHAHGDLGSKAHAFTPGRLDFATFCLRID